MTKYFGSDEKFVEMIKMLVVAAIFLTTKQMLKKCW